MFKLYPKICAVRGHKCGKPHKCSADNLWEKNGHWIIQTLSVVCHRGNVLESVTEIIIAQQGLKERRRRNMKMEDWATEPCNPLYYGPGWRCASTQLGMGQLSFAATPGPKEHLPSTTYSKNGGPEGLGHSMREEKSLSWEEQFFRSFSWGVKTVCKV